MLKELHFRCQELKSDCPVGMEVWCANHCTITTWMKAIGSMDHFIHHKLLVLMIFWQRPHHGLWRWPPASYKMTLENSKPTACYFQRNSWKIWSNYFRAASLRSFLTSDLLLEEHNASAKEKRICAAFKHLLIWWSKLSTYFLSWENLYFPWSGLSSLCLTDQPKPEAEAGQLQGGEAKFSGS